MFNFMYFSPKSSLKTLYFELLYAFLCLPLSNFLYLVIVAHSDALTCSLCPRRWSLSDLLLSQMEMLREDFAYCTEQFQKTMQEAETLQQALETSQVLLCSS